MKDLKMEVDSNERKLIERIEAKFNSICTDLDATYDKLDLAFKKTTRDRSDLELSIK